MVSLFSPNNIARNAAVAAFTQSIRMAPPAWTAPTVQMIAHPPPHRAAMGGVFLPVCLCDLNFCFGAPPNFFGGAFWGMGESLGGVIHCMGK
jgi:hypothetical protein